MPLNEYLKKRKFDHTPEPRGAEKPGRGPLKFVVQKHQASHLHYDFRLEMNGALKSWAVPKGPSVRPGDKRLAMMVEDHPLDYRTFEGVIPEGNYGAGTVMVWDEGSYRAPVAKSRRESEELLVGGLKKGHVTFFLEGKKLKGEFALVRLRRAGENAWLLLKAGDEFARTADITKEDKSVLSGRTVEEISREAKRGGNY